MAKYGGERERESRREAKRQEVEFESSLIWRPDPDRASEQTVDVYPVGGKSRDRITHRIVRYKGSSLVIEFAVTYSVFTGDDEWQEVLCIDTCNHGTVHRHRNGDHSSEPDVIVEVTSQEVLHHALWRAIEEAYDAVDWS